MEKQTIGIKLADGSFYPILPEGQKASKILELTTVRDDQQTVQLDLYRSPDATMDNAEYVDTLLIENLIPRPKEEPTISLRIDLDEDNTLSASIEDKESGESSSLTVSLLNLDATRLSTVPDFALTDENSKKFEFADPADVEEEMTLSEESIDGEEIIDVFEEETFNESEPDIDIPLDAINDEFGEEEVFSKHEDSVNEEVKKNEDFSIDYHFSEVSVLEDVPRQKDDLAENDFTQDKLEEEAVFNNDEELDKEKELTEEDVIKEEDFPDFQDFALSQVPEKEEELQEDTSSLFDFSEEFKDESFDDSIPTPSFSFSDLYEEENMEKEEKCSRKTIIPVIICIVCAIISVVALGLMLWFGPLFSKKDELSSGQSQIPAYDATGDYLHKDVPTYLNAQSTEKLAESEEVFAESTVVEPAKENEIVKIEAEVVEPEVPAVQKTEEKGVSYKIKWGDTLWDISDSYYKNPWLYPKIAKFNSIKNPDLIISGTWITIPPK